jgi:hypothetical protein
LGDSFGVIKKHFGSLSYAGFILGLIQYIRDLVEK